MNLLHFTVFLFCLLLTTGCNSKDKSPNTPKAPFVSENTLRQLEEIEDSITWVPFLLNFPSIPDTNNPNLGYTYTDSGQGGGSQVKHLKGDSLKAQTHCFNFKLNQFKYAYYPFVGWGQDLPLHFSSIKGRFKYLSYSYKGALHSFMPRLSSVKDYGNFQGVAPSTSQWTQVVSKLDQTAQPTFAQKVTWEAKKLYALDWFIQGSDGEVGDLCISNIKFGYFN